MKKTNLKFKGYEEISEKEYDELKSFIESIKWSCGYELRFFRKSYKNKGWVI